MFMECGVGCSFVYSFFENMSAIFSSCTSLSIKSDFNKINTFTIIKLFTVQSKHHILLSEAP